MGNGAEKDDFQYSHTEEHVSSWVHGTPALFLVLQDTIYLMFTLSFYDQFGSWKFIF